MAKGSFVEVWEVGERFLLDDGQSFSGAELLRYTRLCHAIYASLLGLSGRVWLCDAAFFGEAPLRRRVAGHERGAGLRVLNFGPSPIPAISPVPGAKKGSPFSRAPLQGGESGEASEPPHSLGKGDRVGVRVARLRSRPIPLGEGGSGLREVRAGGVAQMHPAPQREGLAAGVGDGVAEPRVAQELRVGLGEVVAAVGLQGAHGLS